MGTDSKRMPPPDGIDPALFSYLQDSFGTLSGQLAEGTRLSRRALELGEENAASIVKLNWHVFGSKPPPSAPGPGSAIVPPLVRMPSAIAATETRITGLDHDAAAAEGREIARDARLARVEAVLETQNKAMGIAPEGAEKPERRRAFLHSSAGRSFMLKLATLILAAVTPILLAVAASRYPAPSATPSAPPAPRVERSIP